MTDDSHQSYDEKRRSRLSQFVKENREKKNFSIDKLSSASTLSIKTLQDIEASVIEPFPKYNTMRKLAKGLGVAYEELKCFVEDTPYNPANFQATKSDFAEFVIERRKKLGISKDSLAQRSGLPSSTIGSIEADYSGVPKSETLVKLAKGLDMSYIELDAIARGEVYTPVGNKYELLRELELHLEKDLPEEVAETLIETLKAVRKVMKKYD